MLYLAVSSTLIQKARNEFTYPKIFGGGLRNGELKHPIEIFSSTKAAETSVRELGYTETQKRRKGIAVSDILVRRIIT